MSIANSQTAEDAQVIIVGGGPVGMGLAIELGQRNIRCIVVERQPHPQPIPKGQNLTQRTMEHFHFWGVEKEVRAARTIPREYGIGGLTAYGTLLGDYSYDWLQRDLVRPFYFTDNERLPQYAMEAVLRRRVAELASVQTLYGWSAEDVSQDDRGAHVVIKDLDGSNRRTLRADYVVGCDGSRSIVRVQGGITQTLSDHDRVMVLLVFRSQGLHRLLEKYPGKSFYNVLHPELDGLLEVLRPRRPRQHLVLPRAGSGGNNQGQFRLPPVSASGGRCGIRCRRRLRRLLGPAVRHRRLLPQQAHLHRRRCRPQPSALRRLRHKSRPGGRKKPGLEARRRPAGLGWTKAARTPMTRSDGRYSSRRRGTSSQKAIETDREFLAAFSPQRDREAFEREWKARQSGARAEINAFEPNYEGSSIACGPPGGTSSALGSHAFTARAGHHLSPHRLPSGRNVFEELGRWLDASSLQRRQHRLHRIRDGCPDGRHPVEGRPRRQQRGRARYQATHVLVRPDQFVAWASGEASVDATAVLGKAIGAG